MKKIGRIIKYYLFKESVKNMELNKIKDKINKRKSLTILKKKYVLSQ